MKPHSIRYNMRSNMTATSVLLLIYSSLCIACHLRLCHVSGSSATSSRMDYPIMNGNGKRVQLPSTTQVTSLALTGSAILDFPHPSTGAVDFSNVANNDRLDVSFSQPGGMGAVGLQRDPSASLKPNLPYPNIVSPSNPFSIVLHGEPKVSSSLNRMILSLENTKGNGYVPAGITGVTMVAGKTNTGDSPSFSTIHPSAIVAVPAQTVDFDQSPSAIRGREWDRLISGQSNWREVEAYTMPAMYSSWTLGQLDIQVRGSTSLPIQPEMPGFISVAQPFQVEPALQQIQPPSDSATGAAPANQPLSQNGSPPTSSIQPQASVNDNANRWLPLQQALHRSASPVVDVRDEPPADADGLLSQLGRAQLEAIVKAMQNNAQDRTGWHPLVREARLGTAPFRKNRPKELALEMGAVKQDQQPITEMVTEESLIDAHLGMLRKRRLAIAAAILALGDTQTPQAQQQLNALVVEAAVVLQDEKDLKNRLTELDQFIAEEQQQLQSPTWPEMPQRLPPDSPRSVSDSAVAASAEIPSYLESSYLFDPEVHYQSYWPGTNRLSWRNAQRRLLAEREVLRMNGLQSLMGPAVSTDQPTNQTPLPADANLKFPTVTVRGDRSSNTNRASSPELASLLGPRRIQPLGLSPLQDEDRNITAPITPGYFTETTLRDALNGLAPGRGETYGGGIVSPFENLAGLTALVAGTALAPETGLTPVNEPLTPGSLSVFPAGTLGNINAIARTGTTQLGNIFGGGVSNLQNFVAGGISPLLSDTVIGSNGVLGPLVALSLLNGASNGALLGGSLLSGANPASNQNVVGVASVASTNNNVGPAAAAMSSLPAGMTQNSGPQAFAGAMSGGFNRLGTVRGSGPTASPQTALGRGAVPALTAAAYAGHSGLGSGGIGGNSMRGVRGFGSVGRGFGGIGSATGFGGATGGSRGGRGGTN